MAIVVAISLLGSFGEYGSPIWWARRLPTLATLVDPQHRDDPTVVHPTGVFRDGDGGVYWLLATGLPGFGQFRYPSKLLTFAVLGLAVLAARQWDALSRGDPGARRRTAAWAGSLLGLTLAVLMLSIARRGDLLAWLEAQKLTSMLGPFDARAALKETQSGLVQAALVLAVSLVLGLGLASRRPAAAAVLALVVTTADLACANARVVQTVPQSVMDATPEALSVIERAEKDRPMPGPYRVHRIPIWSPLGWSETASPDPFGESIVWARRTAEAKFGIGFGLQYTRTLGATALYDYEWFFGGFPYRARDRAARALGVEPGTEFIAFSRRAFDMWNSRYFILPYYANWNDSYRAIASFLDRTERVFPADDAFQRPGSKEREIAWAKYPDYQVRRNLDAYPRTWVVHDARTLPAFTGLTRADRAAPMEEMLFSNDMTWPDPTRRVYNPRRYVWLEESDRAELAPYLPGGYPAPGEAVRVVKYTSDRVALEAILERPGIVILSDVYYPGWSLTIDRQAAPVYRANRMMRGAAVGAGHHSLIYTFRPASFRIGLVFSGLGMVAIGLLALWRPKAGNAESRPLTQRPAWWPH
jgi:hypothetical protein